MNAIDEGADTAEARAAAGHRAAGRRGHDMAAHTDVSVGCEQLLKLEAIEYVRRPELE